MITLEEYYRRLFKYATGWIGWTEEAALHADVNSILAAVEGRVDMLQAIFGKKDDKEDLKKLPMSKRFKMFMKDHNALFRSRDRERKLKRRQNPATKK